MGELDDRVCFWVAERRRNPTEFRPGLADISTVSIAGSASDDWLPGRGVGFQAFDSDTPSSPTYANQPGLGTLLEMRSMAEAGVSSVDVLRAATINNAQAFGLADDHGSIEPGKIANLVLLGQNPLESISSYDTISTVIVHGEVFERASLRATP